MSKKTNLKVDVLIVSSIGELSSGKTKKVWFDFEPERAYAKILENVKTVQLNCGQTTTLNSLGQ